MRITSAEPSPNKKGMVRIHIDGAFAFHMPETIWLGRHLYEKEEWTEGEMDALRHTVLHQAAREASIRYLSVKDRTEQGLLERLVQAGYPQDAAAAAVADMKTMGYVDDRRYAQRFIADQLRLKAISRKNIRLGLKAKGIADEILDEVLDEFEQTDEETAIRSVRKKFGKYDLHDPSVERKAISYLMHRGFSHETVRGILRQIKKELD